MADIIPFRALRYDPQQVPVAQVVTQPYDKISPAMQARYYAVNPHNLVRIILGRRGPEDNAENNPYTRAATYFRDWRGRGVLRQDASPSVYPYSQRFIPPGRTTEVERRGFIALGRVEDYSARVVFRHEQTLAKPKADRLDLLRATRAHFGQLFMLYEDAGEIDTVIFGGDRSPIIDVTDEYGVAHRVWQVSEPAMIDAVGTRMQDRKLIIADGHHRYETALNYRNERRSAGDSGLPGAPYDFAMMTFVDMNSSGLLILPTHRVVHSLTSFSVNDFHSSIRAMFQVEEIGLPLDAARATAILQDKKPAGPALLAVTAGRAFLCHRPTAAAFEVLAGLSPRQQALDVVLLHKCLLEGVLKLSEESIRNQQNISYLRDAAEALTLVREGKANLAFLMNPCTVQQVRDVAFGGEVMPQKSTDFYPKLLSGLTIYALD